MITSMEVRILPKRSENYEAIQSLFKRLCNNFGQSSGEAIIKTIIEELGGMRVSIPDFQDLYRIDRNRKIRNMFNGRNHKELAIIFGMSETHVRNILNQKDDR